MLHIIIFPSAVEALQTQQMSQTQFEGLCAVECIVKSIIAVPKLLTRTNAELSATSTSEFDFIVKVLSCSTSKYDRLVGSHKCVNEVYSKHAISETSCFITKNLTIILHTLHCSSDQEPLLMESILSCIICVHKKSIILQFFNKNLVTVAKATGAVIKSYSCRLFVLFRHGNSQGNYALSGNFFFLLILD